MVGKAGLKAGLIGAAVMVVVTLLNQFILPLTGLWSFLACGISIVLYFGFGVLAGWFLEPERTAGKGAKAGAIAGLVSAVVGGVVGAVIMLVRVMTGGQIPGLDPQQMQMLAESGGPRTPDEYQHSVRPDCRPGVGRWSWCPRRSHPVLDQAGLGSAIN
ncbi:MAG: hypothetical protein ISS56_15290 [Anaerolineae bacterium]|nr:hypothetical protein [Anaerolineae bacterium]